MIGAEAHARLAERRTGILVEAAHFVENLRALQYAERLANLESDAPGEPRQLGIGLEIHHRAEQAHHIGLEPGAQAVVHLVAGRPGEMLVRENAHARLEELVAGLELRHGIAHPADRAVVRQHQRGVGRLGEPVGPCLDLPGQGLAGSIAQGLGLGGIGLGIRHEMEAVQVADMLPLDGDVAGGRNFRFEHRVLSQAPHENARPPVDESLGETFMKRIR